MNLGDLTWPDCAQLSSSLLVVPIGSTEQHGPHLPLSTDTDLAQELARRLADARRHVVVGPTLPYGASGEHAGFPGTLSIGQQALELLLIELVRSATDTFPQVLLLSGHGGNAAPLQRAVAVLQGESRNVRGWLPRWTGDAHAGRIETSIQLDLDASRVRLDLAERGNVESVGALLPAMRAGGVRAVSPNGVLGDPAGASATQGRAVLDQLTVSLESFVSAWLGPTTGRSSGTGDAAAVARRDSR